MNITTLQENFLKGLSRVNRIVSPKPQLPIVGNVLLKTGEGEIVIVATNLETTEITRVPAKIIKEGSICVPAKLLFEFVSSLPASSVDLSAEKESLSIRSAGFHATIPGLSAAEFPRVDIEGGEEMTIKKEEILAAMELVSFSAATDEGRPLLTGIRVTQKEGETVFAATDGFRLTVKRVVLQTKQPLDLIVPTRAVSELLKIANEEKEVEKIGFRVADAKQLVFTVGGTEIHTRLLEGEYPNFEKIIPTKHNMSVRVDKQQLAQAVKSAAIFARDNANIIKFKIEGQTVSVSANAPQVGENQVDVEAVVEGEGGEMAINSRFLIECLAKIPGDEVLFEMTGSLNPGVFKSPADQRFLHIIMPVRAQG